MNNKQYEFKVVVLGDKSVGKTCLVLRFIEGYFAPKQQSTIGAFFLTKKFSLPNGVMCKMQLWDTAGQERFRAMAPVRTYHNIDHHTRDKDVELCCICSCRVVFADVLQRSSLCHCLF